MDNDTNTVVEPVATPVVAVVETTKVKMDAYNCPVTGNSKKTNNVQITRFANKFGISVEDALKSMVSQEGRRVIKEQKLTAEQVTATYGVHPNVASALRCTVKPKLPRKPRAKKVKTVEVVTEAPVAETVETPVDSTEEAVYIEPVEAEAVETV